MALVRVLLVARDTEGGNLVRQRHERFDGES